MTKPGNLRFAPLCMGFFILLAPAEALAGTFPYWGLSFGSAERTAASIGLSFGDSIPGQVSEGFAMGTGPILEGTVGMGGAKLGVGKSFLVLTDRRRLRLLADWKAVVARTWDRPRSASPHSTYLGVEGGLSLSFLRFTTGVSKRLGQRSRGANVLFTWGVGAQIRMGGRGASRRAHRDF